MLRAASIGALLYFITAWGFFFLYGCNFFRKVPVQVCLQHPKYGRICVMADGTFKIVAELAPEESAELEKWVQEHK